MSIPETVIDGATIVGAITIVVGAIIAFLGLYITSKASLIELKESFISIITQKKSLNRYTIVSKSGTLSWGHTTLNNPLTFKALVMDSELKKELKRDLYWFNAKREIYLRLGQALNRTYLIYGEPGTGKRSLVVAMADYMKFNIYEINLASFRNASEFKSLLFAIKSRSIIAIEDLDHHSLYYDRLETDGQTNEEHMKTLARLLAFMDYFWSNTIEQRIVVITTKSRELLHANLSQPGQIHKEIGMTYCTTNGIKELVSSYRKLSASHCFYHDVQDLMRYNKHIKPAEVCERLMDYGNDENVITELKTFLKRKQIGEAYGSLGYINFFTDYLGIPEDNENLNWILNEMHPNLFTIEEVVEAFTTGESNIDAIQNFQSLLWFRKIWMQSQSLNNAAGSS